MFVSSGSYVCQESNISCVTKASACHHTLNGPLTRYVKLRVAHAPGMPGTFSPPPRVIDPDVHHGTCVTHVPWCMTGSITSGFLWSRWRGKRSRHSRRMRNPQFYVSGKRPMPITDTVWKIPAIIGVKSNIATSYPNSNQVVAINYAHETKAVLFWPVRNFGSDQLVSSWIRVMPFYMKSQLW